MKALQRLFVLEIQFQRRLREAQVCDPNVHRSVWESTMGYACLANELVGLDIQQLDRFMGRMLLAGDPRDVLKARDAVAGFLGLG